MKKNKNNSWITAVICMLCITTITSITILQGINTQFYSFAIASLTAVAGYYVGKGVIKK